MNRIATERKRLDLTQEELAEKLNISQKSISKYETGARKPSFETLTEMAKLFNVSTDYLLGLTDIKNEDSHPSDKLGLSTNRLKQLIEELDDSIDLGINFVSSATRIPKLDLEQYLSGNKIPSVYEVCKLVEVLDTTADYLFDKSDIPHPSKKSVYWGYSKDFSYRLAKEMDGSYLETELADELNIPISKVRKMLNEGEMPPPDLLNKMSQILKKSTDYLLGLSESSRKPDSLGVYPFCMDKESIIRLQKLFDNNLDFYAESDPDGLGLTYDEYHMMYKYGFIPHISVLQKLCSQYNVSADYLLNISDSKLSIKISREIDEDDLLRSYRNLDKDYRKKVTGFLSDQLLQQARDKYMRLSVAADTPLKKTGTDTLGK